MSSGKMFLVRNKCERYAILYKPVVTLELREIYQ